MTTTILLITIIFLVAIVAILIFYMWTKKIESKSAESNLTEEAGICKTTMEATSAKETLKEQIKVLLREKGELGNSDIRETLGVPSRTVVRYLDELEDEGKVEQIGASGHNVKYRLK
jgi:predicted HTH transcriptional regulator